MKFNKTQPKKRFINKKKKLILFNTSFVILLVLFIFVWGNIFVTSNNFEKQLNNMVKGEDYFIEKVTITGKKIETYEKSPVSMNENYFFYYGHSGQRMEVPSDTYKEYFVGDQISSYTIDHIHYGHDINAVLPKNEFRNNELMKAIGAVLGILVCCFALLKKFVFY